MNIYSVLKPFYFLLSIFGLFPHSVKYNETKHIFTIIPKSIYVNAMCALTVIITICVFFVTQAIDTIGSWEALKKDNQQISATNFIFQFTSINFVCALVFMCAFLNRHVYVRILNAIAALIQMTNEKQRSILKSLRFQINVVMGGIALTMSVLLCINFFETASEWKSILAAMTFILPQLMQLICLAFHYILVMVLVYALENINDNLRMLHNKNTFDVAVKEKSEKPLVMLRQMELMYAKVYKIKCDVNAAFQAPILLSILQCFHGIVYESYSIYHALVTDVFTIHLLSGSSIWMVCQFLTIYSLARSGNLLITKAKMITQSLHNIRMEDTKVLLKVEHFSSMINHQSVVITVYDFFPLDATLMSGMIATVTMYLIMMVQFDKATE